MEHFEIVGKTLVFTDLHLGLKNSNVLRLGICVKVIKEMLQTLIAENIQNVIFCGDLFHSRKNIDINVLNYGYRLISALAKKAKVYLICGNHDIYYKNIVDINSINIFKDNKNIIVVNTLTDVKINNQTALFVPWLADLSNVKNNSYDMMFGHFDISSRYLIASYIESHSSIKSSENFVNNILEDELFSSNEMTDNNTYDLNDEINEIITKKTTSDNLIGSFIEIVKKNGSVYAGHIHLHKEFVAKGRQFVFVGSPYQQTFGEMDSVDGFYVLDQNNNRTFHEIKTAPKFIKLRVSEILRQGIDKYDFSSIKGNFVRKVYDCNVKKEDDFRISQKIADVMPAEELLSEYDLQMDNSDINSTEIEKRKISNTTLDLIKKSKLDYLRSYVGKIDEKTLKSENLDRKRLMDILEFYYNKTVDEK